MSNPGSSENNAQDALAAAGVDSASAKPLGSAADLEGTVATPTGSAGFKAHLPPDSELTRAVHFTFYAISACGWLLASAWSLGRALMMTGWLAALIVVIPAVAIVLTGFLRTRPTEKQGVQSPEKAPQANTDATK